MSVVLELFAGTKSLGKVAKRKGYKVISLDNEAKFKPDILVDILKWDYKREPLLKNKKVIFLWASPPCASFSRLAIINKQREAKTLRPLNPVGVLGNKILNKTLEIIKYFQRKNPMMFFVIENPRAMMRDMKTMKNLQRSTTLYCLYGSNMRKETDFFNNFPDGIKLNQKKQCPRPVKLVLDMPRRLRIIVPPRIIATIWKQFENQRG